MQRAALSLGHPRADAAMQGEWSEISRDWSSSGRGNNLGTLTRPGKGKVRAVT